jgi:hypothetical protein
MALQKNIKLTDNFGIEIEFPNSYIKVEQIVCTKNNMTIYHNSKKSSEGNTIVSNVINCDYDINGENPIKQAYLHLKTLPEFADAVDC